MTLNASLFFLTAPLKITYMHMIFVKAKFILPLYYIYIPKIKTEKSVIKQYNAYQFLHNAHQLFLIYAYTNKLPSTQGNISLKIKALP